jgi:hypothetical protein
MVDGIIAKIMEEERVEQMEKMKKRNESVEMMRQVRARCAVLCCAVLVVSCIQYHHMIASYIYNTCALLTISYI